MEELRRRLADERQRYAELFELAPDAYFVTDRHGTILEANTSAARLLGIDASGLVGQPLSMFVQAETRRELRRAFLQTSSEPLELELQCASHSGRRFVGHLRIAAADGDPSPARRLCILRDLTPERQAEERYRVEDAERRRLRLLLERLREGVVAVDRNLDVLFVNTEAMRILAPARLEAGRRLPDPWPEISLPAFAQGLFDTAAAPVDRLIGLGGGDRTLSLAGLPAHETDLALLVIVDVSERERRERAEREFVANAAHELRTPLAAITSAVEVLQSGAKEDPQERDRFLLHLERETQRLRLLTQALLLLARVQGGSEQPRTEVIDVGSLLREAAAAFDPGIRVAVEIDCRPDVAALGNRELAVQALATVVANAAKYTDEGRIRLSGRSVNGTAVIEVSDSGPGIPEPERKLVRRRFYRVGDRDHGGGFGLGLAIADQAVAAIGGELEIDSAPEGGTTVRIVLPGAELV